MEDERDRAVLVDGEPTLRSRSYWTYVNDRRYFKTRSIGPAALTIAAASLIDDFTTAGLIFALGAAAATAWRYLRWRAKPDDDDGGPVQLL